MALTMYTEATVGFDQHLISSFCSDTRAADLRRHGHVGLSSGAFEDLILSLN